MDTASSITAPLGRAALGLFAGSVFGLIAEAIFFGKFNGLAVAIGAISVALVSFFAGGLEVRGWFRLLAISIIGGLVLGVLTGAIVIGPTLTYLDSKDEDFLIDKLGAVNQIIGVLSGGIIGTVVGVLAALCIGLKQRRARLLDACNPPPSGLP